MPAGPGRAEPFAAARDLAAWKRRVTRAWGGVRIEHVEGEDGDQGPGGSLVVRATVALGGLSPDDVSVEVVYGRVGDADQILNPAVSSLTVEDGPEDGVARFVGKAELGRPGPFGYTLRVVPRHRPAGQRRGDGPGHPAGGARRADHRRPALTRGLR